MLPRARDISGQQICLADVFVRAAMAGVERDRLPVVLERELVLFQVAVGEPENVLQVSVIGITYFHALEKARGLRPVLPLDGPFARGVVVVAGGEIGIGLVGVGGGDGRERRDRRA